MAISSTKSRAHEQLAGGWALCIYNAYIWNTNIDVNHISYPKPVSLFFHAFFSMAPIKGLPNCRLYGRGITLITISGVNLGKTTPLGGNGMGHPLSKWFVDGVNQAHELGFPFLGDLNFPWLLITTFGTFTFWTPLQKKIEVDGSDDFPLEEMSDFEVPALNSQGCRNGCVLQKTNVNNGRCFWCPIVEIHLYSLPSMKKHVSIATHVLKKKPMQLEFSSQRKHTLHLVTTKPRRSPVGSNPINLGWSRLVLSCGTDSMLCLWRISSVASAPLGAKGQVSGGWSLVRWIGDG